MIETIRNMLREVAKFLVIQMLVVFLFFCLMRTMFSHLESFSTERRAFATLISASLSNFDLSIFENSGTYVHPMYGYVFMVAFLLTSAVTLLNFLIAILSNVYEGLKRQSIGLYLKNIVGIRQFSQYNRKYYSLVSAVPPFNLFIFFCSPLIIWNEGGWLNTVLMHLNYTVVMAIGVIIYTLIAFFMIPLAYVILILKLFKRI